MASISALSAAPPAGPDLDPAGDDYLLRARSLIGRAIRRRWSEGLLNRDPDGTYNGVLGADHIEHLIQPRPRAATPSGPLLNDAVPDPATPLGKLAIDLSLRPTQFDLLAVLLACNTDPTAIRLFSYLSGNPGQFTLTIDLIFDIVYRARAAKESDAAVLLHRDLSAQGFLQRMHFLTIDSADSRVALAQGIRLHPRIIAWLLQDRGLAAELGAHARLYPPELPEGECPAGALTDTVAALAAGRRLLLLAGPIQSGRELLLRFAAQRLGRTLLVASGQGLGPAGLCAAFREACLHRALLVLRDPDDVLDGDALLRFHECLAAYPDTVTLIGAGRSAQKINGLRPTSTITVAVPPYGERLRLWRTYLRVAENQAENADQNRREARGAAVPAIINQVESARPSNPPPALTDDELRQSSALYNLGTAGIIAASQMAREMAAFDRVPLGRSHIARAVRQLFDGELGAIATRVEVSQNWDDLVLADDVAESVMGIIDRIRFRGDVMGDWGFARKLGKGLGLTVLFVGEPGTGKSMVAGLMAAELGLDLYVIDLSRVMSKWLGETEKNLARAFDAAEAGHVLLLFDEADSILGKRSADIRSSGDRHANLETNFILARLEQFQGVALFTTNLVSAVDPAVLRRLSAQIHFPFPDVGTRAELWRRMIPDETPVEGEIDFEELARRFELSGGFIRNIVLRAAYAAVRGGGGVSMELLSHAAEMEYRDRGSLLIGGRLL